MSTGSVQRSGVIGGQIGCALRSRPYGGVMRWDDLFADMEAQLEAARRADLAVEVAERTRAERSTVELVDRLRAACGATVRVLTRGDVRVTGVLVDAAAQWIVLDERGRDVLVPVAAVVAVGGLTPHVAPAAGVVERRLSLGHALRALARDRAVLRVATEGGELVGRGGRVGADHLDLTLGDEPSRAAEVLAVAFAAFRTVRPR